MLERFHPELLNFLSRQVRDRDTAADLAQESYARVLAVQRCGQAIADPRALLFHTARNLVVDQHRRAEVRRHVTSKHWPKSTNRWHRSTNSPRRFSLTDSMRGPSSRPSNRCHRAAARPSC